MSIFPITCAVKCLLGVPPEHPTYIRQAWQDYPAANPPDVPNFFTRVNSYTPKIYRYQRSPANLVYENNWRNNLLKGTGPVSIVYNYLPPADPVPDPNGEIGHYAYPGYGVSVIQSDYLPRWKEDDPYDFTTMGIAKSMPQSGLEYTVKAYASGSDLRIEGVRYLGEPTGSWSLKASVDNLQSRVYNRLLSQYEYYDFKQKTFEYEQTGVAGVWVDLALCCWNEGMTISGKMSFKSIPFTTEARPADNEGGYGFGGMILKVEGEFTDAGEADWSVTLSDQAFSGPLAEVEIPVNEGSITVVSDFWVTDITGP